MWCTSTGSGAALCALIDVRASRLGLSGVGTGGILPVQIVRRSGRPAGNGRPRRAAGNESPTSCAAALPPAIPDRDPAIESVAEDMGPEQQGQLSLEASLATCPLYLIGWVAADTCLRLSLGARDAATDAPGGH
jgi:hypothetical protein